MENQDFELVFVDDSDTDNASEIISEKKELANYSYISNGLYFEYFVAYEIIALIGYKHITQCLENVSKQNPLYGLVGYSIIQNVDASTIVKSPNTTNYIEFRFSIGVT